MDVEEKKHSSPQQSWTPTEPIPPPAPCLAELQYQRQSHATSPDDGALSGFARQPQYQDLRPPTLDVFVGAVPPYSSSEDQRPLLTPPTQSFSQYQFQSQSQHTVAAASGFYGSVGDTAVAYGSGVPTDVRASSSLDLASAAAGPTETISVTAQPPYPSLQHWPTSQVAATTTTSPSTWYLESSTSQSQPSVPSDISYVKIKFDDDDQNDDRIPFGLGIAQNEEEQEPLARLWGESLGGTQNHHHLHPTDRFHPTLLGDQQQYNPSLSLDDYESAFQNAVLWQQQPPQPRLQQQQQPQPRHQTFQPPSPHQVLPTNPPDLSVHPLKRDNSSNNNNNSRGGRRPPAPPPPPQPPPPPLKAPPSSRTDHPLPPQHRRAASDSAHMASSGWNPPGDQTAAGLQRQASQRLRQLEQRLHSQRMHADVHRGSTIFGGSTVAASAASPRKNGSVAGGGNSSGRSTDPLRARKRWDGGGGGGGGGGGAPRPQRHHQRSGSWSAEWNATIRTHHHHRSYGTTGGGGSVSSVKSASSVKERYHADAGGKATGGVVVNFPGNLLPFHHPPPHAPSVSGRQHRRTPSALSAGAMSVATDMSLVSYVADIRKSQFFSHYDTKGQAQLFFPISRVHLVMNDSSEHNAPPSGMHRNRPTRTSSRTRRRPKPPALPVGRLYQVPIDPEAYELYHRYDDEDGGLDGDYDDVSLLEAGDRGTGVGGCECPCPHCAACTGGRQAPALPPAYYAMAVPDDLYKRVLDEIVMAHSMPCRSYFCGHHEDVSRPSAAIAGAIVGTLFLLMGAAAYSVQS